MDGVLPLCRDAVDVFYKPSHRTTSFLRLQTSSEVLLINYNYHLLIFTVVFCLFVCLFYFVFIGGRLQPLVFLGLAFLSLFNVTSAFVGYLLPKLYLLKNNCKGIQCRPHWYLSEREWKRAIRIRACFLRVQQFCLYRIVAGYRNLHTSVSFSVVSDFDL